jgi:hypothetical protein
VLDHSATPEIAGIVDDGFEAEDALAFGIRLEGQVAKVDLEHAQAILRCLEHDRQPWLRSSSSSQTGTLLGAEHGP